MKLSFRDMKVFGRELKQALKSDEAYAILGKNGTWTAGGCWILATALKRLLGPRSTLVAITWGGDNMPQHVLVELDGLYFDADGVSTERILLRRWRTIEGVKDARIQPLAERAHAADIPFSARKAERLAAWLVGRELETPTGKRTKGLGRECVFRSSR